MLIGRTIFVRLFSCFAIIVLVAGLVSGGIIYSLSHASIKGVRDSFHSRLVNNVARTSVLMGRVAYIIYENRGLESFLDYLYEVEDSMRTELSLMIGDTLYPQDRDLSPELLELARNSQGEDDMQILEDGRQVLVARSLLSPSGVAYTVIGVHRLFPPPPVPKGMPPPQEKELGRLNELIGQLLRLSKFEKGQVAFEKATFDLALLVRSVAEDVSFELEKSGKQVKITDASDSLSFNGSEEHIRQAVENIVRNAAQFTSAGTSVEVSLSLEESVHTNKDVVVSVRDFGPRIPEKELSLVLEPFYRVSSARERQGMGSGVGIGLAIVSQAVKLHGGSLVLENCREGRGLSVSITLPLFS